MDKPVFMQAEEAYIKAKSALERHLTRDGFIVSSKVSAGEDSLFTQFDAWLDKIAVFYFRGVIHKRIALYQIAYILVLLADFKESAAHYFSLLSRRKKTAKTSPLATHV